eukprot:6213331-Pleurochrysis_carterae.AAC.1
MHYASKQCWHQPGCTGCVLCDGMRYAAIARLGTADVGYSCLMSKLAHLALELATVKVLGSATRSSGGVQS